MFEEFWERTKTYKGGGALATRPPFVGFFSDPKLFRQLLKSRIFSFQSLLACRGSQKLHFGDLGLTQKSSFILGSFWGTFLESFLVVDNKWEVAMWTFIFCARSNKPCARHPAPMAYTAHKIKHFSKHNTLHWDRISNFSLFCHQNVTFVL